MITKIIYNLILALTAASIIMTLRENWNARFAVMVWKKFTPLTLLKAFGLVVLTIFCVGMLAQVPVLKYGWLHLLTPKGGNAMTSGVGYSFTGILFALLLMIAFPFLANIEEQMFREGHTEFKTIIPQSIKFGLVHMIMGVPLCAGIGLAVPGFFYALCYRKHFFKSGEEAALFEATILHSAYNSIVILIVVICSAILK